jgi:hypothetical protein
VNKEPHDERASREDKLRRALEGLMDEREARAEMSRELLGFIDETQVWQANLIDALHINNWRQDRAGDMEQFSLHLANGAQIDAETSQRRFHSLLQFDEFEERHEIIAEAHKKTFEWVFHGGPFPKITTLPDAEGTIGLEPEWHSFTEWLEGDKDIYWITGKPGSGKSTLMKFLYNEERTRKLASKWSGTKTLITAGFFFWNSGTAMQMSRMGLLQTLLQCLENRQHLIPYLFPTRWNQHLLAIGGKQPWTWLELTSALKALMAMENFAFLFFIDGLDEFDGNPQDVATLMLDMKRASVHRTRLCVASRPWLEFEESFSGIPWLKMEDLTRKDIQLYVEENMQSSTRWRELTSIMPEEANNMIDEITHKATGVFLWVILVVASLLGGLRDGDGTDDLWKRINELPTTLEDLFQKILGDLNPRYFTQACELFQLAFTAFEPLTLLDMSYALDGCAAAINASMDEVKRDELDFRAETMRRRINSRSKGLLEVPTASIRKEHAKVEYLHRTVRDFFQSEQAWAYIRSGAPKFDAPLELSAAFVRHVKTTRTTFDKAVHVWNGFWRSFLYSIEYLRKRDSVDDKSAIYLLDTLSKTGDTYWTTQLIPALERSGERMTHPTWRKIVMSCPPTTTFHAWGAETQRPPPHWYVILQFQYRA